MKNVIQRALPLTVKYDLLGVSYNSIENGGGCSCDNCGRLICNVATVKSVNGTYNIGTDCLETILLNNNLLNDESRINYLFSDKPAIAKAKSLRSKIIGQLKKDEKFKTEMYYKEGERTFGFSFSLPVTREGFIWIDGKPLKDENGEYITEMQSYDEPRGFNFTFFTEYKDLTLAYIKDLPGVTLM